MKQKKKVVKEILNGTIRIGKNLKIYEKADNGWKTKGNVKDKYPNTHNVINLFKANKKYSELIDKKSSRFLKGQLSPKEKGKRKIQGARINILPDGRKLDGAYSLLAEGITIHDQTTNKHWDVIYKNPNGKYAYHYTLDKKKKAKEHKFETVKNFSKKYKELNNKLNEAIKDNKDFMALPIMTLIKTHMRVGNEIYYLAHKHKGLTTIKKKDIKIIRENKINFRYLGKDGVPQNKTKEFTKEYIHRIKKLMKKKKNNDFLFTKPNGKMLKDGDFKKAFKKYVGVEFYPHIIRSYYATKKTGEYIKEVNKRKNNPPKKEVKEFLKGVAEELGHKKFSKKTGLWEDSYTVTIGHYIQPQLAEKIRGMI